MFRAALLALLIALPSAAFTAERQLCVGDKTSPIPQLLGESYSKARAQLLENGWQPYKFGPGNDEQKWARDAGYTELEGCRNSGPVPCRFNMKDKNGNILHIVTFGDEAWNVVQYFFLCEGDDIPPGYVFNP